MPLTWPHDLLPSRQDLLPKNTEPHSSRRIRLLAVATGPCFSGRHSLAEVSGLAREFCTYGQR